MTRVTVGALMPKLRPQGTRPVPLLNHLATLCKSFFFKWSPNTDLEMPPAGVCQIQCLRCQQLGMASRNFYPFLSFSFYKSNYVQKFHYSRPVRRGTVDPENEFAVSISPPLPLSATRAHLPTTDAREPVPEWRTRARMSQIG